MWFLVILVGAVVVIALLAVCSWLLSRKGRRDPTFMASAADRQVGGMHSQDFGDPTVRGTDPRAERRPYG